MPGGAGRTYSPGSLRTWPPCKTKQRAMGQGIRQVELRCNPLKERRARNGNRLSGLCRACFVCAFLCALG